MYWRHNTSNSRLGFNTQLHCKLQSGHCTNFNKRCNATYFFQTFHPLWLVPSGHLHDKTQLSLRSVTRRSPPSPNSPTSHWSDNGLYYLAPTLPPTRPRPPPLHRCLLLPRSAFHSSPECPALELLFTTLLWHSTFLFFFPVSYKCTVDFFFYLHVRFVWKRKHLRGTKVSDRRQCTLLNAFTLCWMRSVLSLHSKAMFDMVWVSLDWFIDNQKQLKWWFTFFAKKDWYKQTSCIFLGLVYYQIGHYNTVFN